MLKIRLDSSQIPLSNTGGELIVEQYYRLTLDINIPGAWYLAEIIDGNGDEILASGFMTEKFFESTSNISVIPNLAGKPG